MAEPLTLHPTQTHAYHSALMDRAVSRYDRAARVEGWFALAAIVAVGVMVAAAIGGAR